MDVRIMTALLVSAMVGMMLAVPLTPVMCLLRKIFYVPFIRGRLMEGAVAKGHVVTAHLEKSGELYDVDEDDGRIYTNWTEGVYRYTYNGRNYRYRYRTTGEMAPELTLYFQRRPGRACLARELGARESPLLKCYALTALLAAAAVCAILLFGGGRL